MPSTERWVIRDALVAGVRTDCRIRDGRVMQLQTGLESGPGEQVLDAGGGELLPGLADHHLHLFAAASARDSLDLGGGDLDAALGADAADGTWLRVIGAGSELTRADVDRVWPGRPVRVQHRSGALWTLNTLAVQALRPGASPEELRTGQFWRASTRLRALLEDAHRPDLAGLSLELASYGVTHVTDATPDFTGAEDVKQHVLSLGVAGDQLGPRKIFIADHEAVDFDELVHDIRDARADGRGVALHAVTAIALAVAIAALEQTGVHGQDRIEHAAVCSEAAARWLAEHGVAVVTQPSLLARHGRRYVHDSEPSDRADLWRHAGLLRAGVRVAVSSDAPYGDLNPFATIRAAVTRNAGGTVIGPDECVTPETAFASLLADPHDPGGPPRRVTVGASADLCLLDTSLSDALAAALAYEAVHVHATFVDGRRVSTDRPDELLAG